MSYYPAIQTQAMCIPSTVQPGCVNCSRFRPDKRGIETSIVIDATVLKWDGGMCPMRVIS